MGFSFWRHVSFEPPTDCFPLPLNTKHFVSNRMVPNPLNVPEGSSGTPLPPPLHSDILADSPYGPVVCAFPVMTLLSRASARVGSFPLPSQRPNTSRCSHLLRWNYFFPGYEFFGPSVVFGWARSSSFPPYLCHSTARLFRVFFQVLEPSEPCEGPF